MTTVRIGTAGWSIPRDAASHFPDLGSSLERYSSRFHAVEINSSFHRVHRISTWERWRETSPPAFRFSVKLPKTITHERRLRDVREPLDDFLLQVDALKEKLAVLLVQLPPKLEFEAEFMCGFFAKLVDSTDARIACEPRHPSWFGEEADALLVRNMISRVAADPAIAEAGGTPGGHLGLRYWRLHGSPVMYRSSYADRLAAYGKELVAHAGDAETWCIFDNTASSAATTDALALSRVLAD